MGKAIIGKKLGMTQLFDQESGVVTAVTTPVSWSNSWVMPSFLPMMPLLTCPSSLQLDLDVDTGRQVESHQRVDGLRRGVEDVDEPLVRADLEVLT